jgi:hypothetical protein
MQHFVRDAMALIEQHAWSVHVSLLTNSMYSVIVYCSRIFHSYGDVTITDEGLQNLGQCSAIMAFYQGGIFIVPPLL